MLTLLLPAVLSIGDADLQNTLVSIPTFQQQFAANLAKAGGNIPGRFSYFVNSVHPVQPKQTEDPAQADLPADLPAPSSTPQFNLPAWNGFLGYNGYNRYNPWAAGYNALGYPWGRGGYGGYNRYPNYGSYSGYGLNPYVFQVRGVREPNAGEDE